jgi:hypothetical protein
MSMEACLGAGEVTMSVRRIAAVAAIALVSACTNEVGGTPTEHRIPGTVQSSVLGVDEISALVGTTLMSGGWTSEPPPPLAAEPATCVVAVGPATQAVYARGWTTFWSETFSDVNGDHTATQVLGMYPDGGQAQKVFTTLANGVKGCASAVRTDEETTSKWSYAVDTADTGALTWTATQDAADGWACYRQARLKGKAVLQVAVCEAGNGEQAVAKIAERFAGRVGGR